MSLNRDEAHALLARKDGVSDNDQVGSVIDSVTPEPCRLQHQDATRAPKTLPCALFPDFRRPASTSATAGPMFAAAVVDPAGTPEPRERAT